MSEAIRLLNEIKVADFNISAAQRKRYLELTVCIKAYVRYDESMKDYVQYLYGKIESHQNEANRLMDINKLASTHHASAARTLLDEVKVLRVRLGL